MTANSSNIAMLRALGDQLEAQRDCTADPVARHILQGMGRACTLAAEDLADSDAALEAKLQR